MTLTEFLRARLDEDERHARKLAESDRRPVLSLATTVNHPERLLLEVEAKRAIVDDYADAEQAVRGYDHDAPTDAYWQEWGNRHALRLAVERLGTVYADHDDYDERWRP